MISLFLLIDQVIFLERTDNTKLVIIHIYADLGGVV